MPLVGRADFCPPNIEESGGCPEYLEAALIRQYPKLFVRQGGVLNVYLLNGRVQHFKDTPLNEKEDNIEKFVSYSLQEVFPEIGYALINVSVWEGGTYYLLNLKTGVQTDVGGEAVISPDKRRLAVWNVDIEAEYTANVLAVYRVTASDLVEEFRVSPDDWGADDVVWQGNGVIRFTRNYWGESDIEKREQILRLVDTGKSQPAWRLDSRK